MKNIILEQKIIDSIVESLKPISIYIVGSSILNIDNPNDIDILCIVEGDTLKKRFHLYSNKYNARVEVFNATQNQVLDSVHRICYAWSYLKDFRQCIYGDDILAQFDSTETLNNKEYKITLCKKIYQDFKDAEQLKSTYGLNFLCKPYRMLIIYYTLLNNSCTYTEKQIKILNEVHDSRKLDAKLYNECKQFFYNEIVEICN